MPTLFHTMIYWTCDYLSSLGLKLIQVSKWAQVPVLSEMIEFIVLSPHDNYQGIIQATRTVPNYPVKDEDVRNGFAEIYHGMWSI